MKYSYSHDGESFSGECDTVVDAILESILDDCGEYETVFIGESHKKTIGGYLKQIDVEKLLEGLTENAQNECGKSAEDWLHGPVFKLDKIESLSDRQTRYEAYKLAKNDRLAFLMDGFKIVLETWATDAKKQPDFWHVRNVKRYNCTTMELVESV